MVRWSLRSKLCEVRTMKITPEQQIAISLADAQQSNVRALYYKARVDNGVYKLRVGHAFHGGLPENGGVAFTEQELLADELATMHRHIQLAEGHLDFAKSIAYSMD